jgi:flagella basal body P-ring formation protein FlgA
MDQVVGMTPLRPIAAGSVVRPEIISRPNDVSRGDLIEIEVLSGAARVVLTARAESGGRNGETIAVRNLESNRVFSAQVAGKGRAVVLTDFMKAE